MGMSELTAYARAHFPELCQAREVTAHKGTFGTAALVGGSAGMSGAVVLAATAALLLGAGKVVAAFAEEKLPTPWISAQPEIMLSTNQGMLERADISAWGIGCGFGQSASVLAWLKGFLTKKDAAPAVLDADAINLLAQHAILRLPESRLWILTPHPAEAARLLRTDTQTVQANRINSAWKLVQHYRAWVVLKGHESVVMSPQGEYTINPSGNVGLATAGSGDVLTGMITSLLAQGLDAATAVRGAVWLHGAAADVLVAGGVGPIGLTAGELARAARNIRNVLVQAA